MFRAFKFWSKKFRRGNKNSKCY